MTSRLLLLVSICLLASGCIQSCREDESSADDTSDDGAHEDPAVARAWNQLAERARAGTCEEPLVTAPPPELGLDPFYGKYASACGIPVVGSPKVQDQALIHAARLVTALTGARPTLRQRMIRQRVRVALLAVTESATALPEYAYMRRVEEADPASRGYRGRRSLPLVSVGEENVLCYSSDRYREDPLLVRRLALAMLEFGLEEDIPDFSVALKKAHYAARSNRTGKTPSSTRQDFEEYWAEGARSWFQTGDSAGSSTTRQALRTADPQLAVLLEKVFGPQSVEYCPSTAVQPRPNEALRELAKQNADADADECGSPTVTVPPTELGLDPHYEKYTDVCGIAVVASGQVRDRALLAARPVIIDVTAHMPGLRSELSKQGLRIAIIGVSEHRNEIPEHSGRDKSSRGTGATMANPVSSVGEENVLCLPSDTKKGLDDILVHELAHAVMNVGLPGLDAELHARIEKAYRAAMHQGLWKGTYSATNSHEYWAEGTQTWFEVNHPDEIAGFNLSMTTREALASYDPELSRLLAEVYSAEPEIRSCTAYLRSRRPDTDRSRD